MTYQATMTYQAIRNLLVTECELTKHDDFEDIVDAVIGFLADSRMPTTEAEWAKCRRIARVDAERFAIYG